MPKFYIKSGNLDFCCLANDSESAIAKAVNYYREMNKDVSLSAIIGVNEHGFLEFDRITKDERQFPTRETIAKMFGDT